MTRELVKLNMIILFKIFCVVCVYGLDFCQVIEVVVVGKCWKDKEMPKAKWSRGLCWIATFRKNCDQLKSTHQEVCHSQVMFGVMSVVDHF